MNTENAIIVKRAADKAFASLIPSRLDSPEARVLMYAITKQESAWKYRDQLEANGRDTVPGPAMGLGQFELGGGVKGVMEHRASRDLARAAAIAARVPWNRREVWLSLEVNDALAMAFVRLLLYTDPASLPAIGEEETAWQYYLRNWRPGAYTRGSEAKRKQLRAEWKANYRAAVQLVKGES